MEIRNAVIIYYYYFRMIKVRESANKGMMFIFIVHTGYFLFLESRQVANVWIGELQNTRLSFYQKDEPFNYLVCLFWNFYLQIYYKSFLFYFNWKISHKLCVEMLFCFLTFYSTSVTSIALNNKLLNLQIVLWISSG